MFSVSWTRFAFFTKGGWNETAYTAPVRPGPGALWRSGVALSVLMEVGSPGRGEPGANRDH